MRPKDGGLWNWPMIYMVNREQALAMNEAGFVFPITTWFDEEGEELPVEERSDAVTCVAGMDGYGWDTIDLRKFVQETPQ